MMLGSEVKEDKCQECGGDGSNCKTVEGIFNQTNLQVGKFEQLFIFFFFIIDHKETFIKKRYLAYVTLILYCKLIWVKSPLICLCPC